MCADHQKTAGKTAPTAPTASTGRAPQGASDAQRLAKFAQAKLVRAQKERQAAVAQAKKASTVQAQAIAEAQEAAITSFCRAMRIVAKRFEVDLETAPLKQAAEAVLAEPRTLGVDAATQEPIVYGGLDGELARYLTAQLYNVGHRDHLEALTKRARELMKSGDAYLIAAEADLRNMQPVLPSVRMARSAALMAADEDARHADQMRRSASNGNLRLTPAASDAGAPGTGYGSPAGLNGFHRSALSEALGGTTVEAHRSRLGLSN